MDKDISAHYSCMTKGMVHDWRTKWGLKTMPFFFTQLAPYTQGGPYGQKLATMRLVQSGLVDYADTMCMVGPSVCRAALRTSRPGSASPDAVRDWPSSAQATAVDLGDVNSPFGNIHPRNKSEVGRRLGLCARALCFGEAVLPTGPVYASSAATATVGEAAVQFVAMGSAEEQRLMIRAGTCPVAASECAGFELQDKSGKWHAATAVVSARPREVLVRADGLKQRPVAVRYGFNDWPVTTLFNGVGLPALPFYGKCAP